MVGDVSKMKIRMHPGTFDGTCGEDVSHNCREPGAFCTKHVTLF